MICHRMGNSHPCLGNDFALPFNGTEFQAWKTESEPQVREAMPVIMAVNEAVKAALEQARREKIIGSSLQSRVIISLDPPKDGQQATGASSRVLEALRWFEDELADAFVVSDCEVDVPVPQDQAFHFSRQVAVGGETATVHVLPPMACKCPRCWRYLAPVEEQLCTRCEGVVESHVPAS